MPKPMLEFALWFYQNYVFLFYLLLAIAVLLEWPILILTLTILAPKLGISIALIFMLSLFGDFGGDLLHFLVGKYGRKRFFKNKKARMHSEKISKVKAKIDDYPLLEKLIIIKYTPPITSVGLLYLWSTKLKTLDFIKKALPLCISSSVTVIIIGYYFGQSLKNQENIVWVLFGIGVAIALVLFLFRTGGKLLLDKIYSTKKHS